MMGRIADEIPTATQERIRQLYRENKDSKTNTEGLLAIASSEKTPDDVLDDMINFSPPSAAGAVFGGPMVYISFLVTKLHIGFFALANKVRRMRTATPTAEKPVPMLKMICKKCFTTFTYPAIKKEAGEAVLCGKCGGENVPE